MERDVEKEIFDLRQLIEISKSLNSTLEFHVVLESMLYTCLAQLQVMQAGMFTRRDIQSRSLTLHRNAIGFAVDADVEVCIDEHSQLFELLGREHAAFSPAELSERGIPGDELEPIARHSPALVVPVSAKSELNGVLMLGPRLDGASEFSEYEERYLLDLASIAGTALHNAFLFEVTNTDLMTRLKMRHYFLTMLGETISRASRDGDNLCVAMLDLDRFKRVNDTYCHVVGDEVLKGCSQVILENVRQSDIAARYGGEEFILLLPHTRIEDAEAICERIRIGVAERSVWTGSEWISVTISIGVARYEPERDHTAHLFIDRADQALYRSKRAGRDRVTRA